MRWLRGTPHNQGDGLRMAMAIGAMQDRQITDLACAMKISTRLVDNLVEKINPADSNRSRLAIPKGLHKI